MEPFLLKTGELSYFSIPSWEKISPSLSVGFSIREGGTSTGNFNSFNLALHVRDSDENVIENRKKLAAAINFPFSAWTTAEQVHGNNVEIITLAERGRGRNRLEDSISNTDGILTNVPDILLTSYYADCVPLYFFDPVKKIIGLAHAGWKGTVLKIGEKMVSEMIKNFNSRPEDIKVVIGPSIGQCCYEVNKQVINPLKAELTCIPDEAILVKGNEHFNLDLKKINNQIMIKAGILPQNIEISSLCTGCNTDLFFSHRMENGITGRMASWIGMRKDE